MDDAHTPANFLPPALPLKVTVVEPCVPALTLKVVDEVVPAVIQ